MSDCFVFFPFVTDCAARLLPADPSTLAVVLRLPCAEVRRYRKRVSRERLQVGGFPTLDLMETIAPYGVPARPPPSSATATQHRLLEVSDAAELLRASDHDIIPTRPPWSASVPPLCRRHGRAGERRHRRPPMPRPRRYTLQWSCAVVLVCAAPSRSPGTCRAVLGRCGYKRRPTAILAVGDLALPSS